MQFFDRGLIWFTIVVSAALTILAVGFIAVVVRSRHEIMKARQKSAEEADGWKEKYMNLFGNSLVGMIRLSLHDWSILEANHTFLQMAANIPLSVGRNFLNCLNPGDQEKFKTRLYNEGVIDGFQGDLHCSDGSTLWLSVSGRVYYQEGYADCVVMDVTSRVNAEERLREQSAFIENAHDAIIVLSTDNIVRFWNSSAERMYLWSAAEAVGKPIADLIYLQEDNPIFRKRREELLQHGVWSGEIKQIRKDGGALFSASRWTLIRDADNRPGSILEIHTDITEKKTLESKFLRMQRLESLGMLAGGIAHDLNDVLAPIILNIQSLKKKWDDPASREYLATLEASAHKGASLVKQVLAFARGVEGQRVPVRVREVVRDVLSSASHTISRTIELEDAIADDLWPAIGDALQIQQVLLNLVLNAKDAMPNGGKLSISAENFVVDEKFAANNPEARPGVYVLIQVTDTGKGIPTSERDKIFEPFYTTKSVGQGTGLGLSTALGIVKSHDGFILVDSRPGAGSTFKVFLPAQLYQSPEASKSHSSQ